jgi:hypothetical protein
VRTTMFTWVVENDCLTWMMDDAEGNPARDNDRDVGLHRISQLRLLTVSQLSLRIMGLNFGAIHTSSNVRRPHLLPVRC